jgi:hypothetical protein
MKITSSNRHIWENLFQAAIDFRDLKPWEWMYDADIFGVEDPETGEIGWCSVMGAGGQVYSLTVYPGEEGFYTFDRLASLDDETLETDYIAAGIEMKILQVEFTGREEITDVDRAAFKALGLKFRGDGNWVQIREMQPGYMPWYLSDDQAVFLTHCLRQAIEVALRFQEDEDIIADHSGDPLVRTPDKTAGGIRWSDRYQPEPEWSPPPRKADPFLLNRAKKELKVTPTTSCFALDYIPGGFNAEGDEERPFFSKIAIWMDYESGMILGTDLFTPKLFEISFDKVFFQKLHEFGSIPQQWLVDSRQAYHALEPIAHGLGSELILAPDEDVFQEVRDALGMFFGGF